MIQRGEAAPPFEVEDWEGRRMSLEDFRGKPLLLSFNRYASCPLCNLHIHKLTESFPKLEKKLSILAFFESPKESLRQYVGKQKPPFPLIPDPSRKIYSLYGVKSSWLKTIRALGKPGKMLQALRLGFLPGKMEGDKAIVPADFLLDPDLTVVEAHYGKDISDHMAVEDLPSRL